MNDNNDVHNNDLNLLRDTRDYTSRLDLYKTPDHTINIAHPAGTELAEILARPRELTSRNLGTGSSGVTPAVKHTRVGQ